MPEECAADTAIARSRNRQASVPSARRYRARGDRAGAFRSLSRESYSPGDLGVRPRGRPRGRQPPSLPSDCAGAWPPLGSICGHRTRRTRRECRWSHPSDSGADRWPASRGRPFRWRTPVSHISPGAAGPANPRASPHRRVPAPPRRSAGDRKDSATGHDEAKHEVGLLAGGEVRRRRDTASRSNSRAYRNCAVSPLRQSAIGKRTLRTRLACNDKTGFLLREEQAVCSIFGRPFGVSAECRRSVCSKKGQRAVHDRDGRNDDAVASRPTDIGREDRLSERSMKSRCQVS